MKCPFVFGGTTIVFIFALCKGVYLLRWDTVIALYMGSWSAFLKRNGAKMNVTLFILLNDTSTESFPAT